MIKKILTPIICSTGLLLPSSLALAQSKTALKWHLTDDRDGIQVFACQEQDLGTVSVRGEGWLDAPPEQVFQVMADNDHASEWMPMVIDKHTLRQISASERLEFTRIDMPWPLSDRYFVNQGRVEYLPKGAIRLSIRSTDDAYPNPQDLVRATLHYSEFLLTPDPTGQRTKLTLEVNSNPNGAIPTWLVNTVQKSWPRDFMMSLKKQLQKTPATVPSKTINSEGSGKTSEPHVH
jgi:uncharacterized protein YndB with AHSA1/START domain